MENTKEEELIDLTRYFDRFLKMLRWTLLPILMIGILWGCWQYYRSYRSYTPYYQTSALLTVQTGQNEDDIFNNSIYYDAEAVEAVVEVALPFLKVP